MDQNTASAAAGNAAGTPPAASTAANLAGAAASAPPPAATPSWLDGADELTVGYVQNKGWQEPKQVLEGYRNLEKLLGADKAGNAVILPKEGATPEEMSAFFNRIGRPEKSDGYKINVPEGFGDKEFATAAAAKFHELGLTSKQGEELSSWWNQNIGGKIEQTQAQQQQQFASDNEALTKEWGAAYQQNVMAAQKAVQGLGLDSGTIDKIASAIGHKATMELFNKVGTRVLEDKFVSGDQNNSFGDAMTPGQAQAELSLLKQDKTFVSQYLSKNKDAVEKMQRLMKFAYPE